MLWERDYMKRPLGDKGDANVADTNSNEVSEPGPIDIFDGVKRQDLHSQAPPTKASGDSKTDNSIRNLSSSTPLATDQPELPLNRLLAKHPRMFWYAVIAILGIIIGLLLGRS